ncbi:MAG: beta-propeller domain-containing protein [Thermoguttaceae bacterium]
MFRSLSPRNASAIGASRPGQPGPFCRTRRLTHEFLESRLVLSGAPLDEPLQDGGFEDPAGEAILLTTSTGEPPASAGDPAASATAWQQFAGAEDLKQFLLDDALARWDSLFGQPAYWYCWYGDDGLRATLAVAGDAENTYSQTNVQVSGVDEPDLVETDGQFVYSLSAQELTVVQVGDADELAVAARVPLETYATGMLLSGNRLTVLGTDWGAVAPIVIGGGWSSESRCTVTVFDVSDPAHPSVVEKTEIDGQYVDARAVGDQVVVVTRSDFFLPPPLILGEPWPDPIPLDNGAGDLLASDDVAKGAADLSVAVPGDANLRPDPYQRTYETKEAYLARIQDQVLKLVIPSLSVGDASGSVVDSGWLLEPGDIYRPLSDDDIALVSITLLDLGDQEAGPTDTVGVPSPGATEIYLSGDGLFLLGTRWDWAEDNTSQTSILKFDLDAQAGAVTLSAAGSVAGRLLDQFSFDVHEGLVRVATIAGTWAQPDNSLFVLRQEGDTFQEVGRLAGIAPGEQIYAARFLGDQAYLVTFRRIDPLFTIDLANPAEPRLAGELEIPGFSNYLQPAGDGYLLGMGSDADPETGRVGQPQVSLFDVSDMANPRRVDFFTIPTDLGGWNLFGDHHQVAWFPEYGVLTVLAPGGEPSWQNVLWVLRVDTSASGTEDDRAIEPLGTIQHDTSLTRAVRLGDRLVAVSDQNMTLHDLLAPADVLAQVPTAATWLGPVGYVEIDQLAPSQGDRLFSLEATITGLLTFDALFDRSGGSDVTLTLYTANLKDGEVFHEDPRPTGADHFGPSGSSLWLAALPPDQMQELAVSVSNYPWAQARLDWQAQAGQRFYLKVSGTAAEVNLRIVNAVSLPDGPTGTQITITAPTWDSPIQYQVYWHSEGGNPWDEGLKTQAFTRRQSIDVAGVHYDLPMNQPRVVLEGLGASTLTVDVSKIALDEAQRGDIVVDLADGSGTITTTGPAFGWDDQGNPIRLEMSISGFAEVTVNNGQVARLRGSDGTDTFISHPGSAVMQTPGGSVTVNGFREVHGYSSPNQSDVAMLYDTPGNDLLVATPDYARITGQDYVARAKGFRYTHSYSTAGGVDEAKLKDSLGDDFFVATPQVARLRGNNYDNRVKAFRYVHAYASRGTDEARFYESAGADTFVAAASYAKLFSGTYANRAKFFDKVDLRAGTGGDTAVLRDAVLTTAAAPAPAQDQLLAEAWLYGLERCELRGSGDDQRPDTQSVDQLLAYWPR